jgi:hypothetical protein
MWKPFDRPLTLGCSLALMFLMLAAWGRWSEHRGLPHEAATGRGLSVSGVIAPGPQCAINGFASNRALPSSYLDILDDEEDEDDNELRLGVFDACELARLQHLAVRLSDAHHTTLAPCRCARLAILRC